MAQNALAPAIAASARLATRIVTSRTESGVIWQALESRLRSTGLTDSWAWTSCWLETWGSSVPHWFVIAEHDNSPVGIALLTRGRGQRRGPLPVRTVHIGTAGERPAESVFVEYNRLLVDPRFRTHFLHALLDVPGVRFGSTDALELNGFAPEEISPDTRTRVRISERTCFVARLSPDGQNTLATFDSDTRRKIRGSLARVEADFGAIATEWVTDCDRARRVFCELIERHQQRWTSAGHGGAFASERSRRFHRHLIERLLPEGRIALIRVTAGDHLIGIFYGFTEDGALLHYQWGLGRFDDNRVSPGFVTGYQTMVAAGARGLTELNWLAGDDRYKRDLSNTTRTLIWGERTVSPWLALINGLIKIKHTMRGQT